ncbi:RNA polymerase sigma-70 factor, ECF subfamily [bacterium A37T11]|nr:RNA polymerase sigma-70 factor, ECF subfamily [bacterium A37T11]
MSLLQTLDDKALLSLVKGGDQRAYAEIFSRYSDALYQKAFSLLKDADVASDMVQDVFLRLWEKREELELREALGSYLYQSIRHLSLNELRRAGRYDQRMDDFARFVLDRSPSADYELRSKELEAAIAREIALMPARMREVFLLRKNEDLSYQEIADKLNISPMTVKSQLHKAVQLLWRKLSGFLMVVVILSLL